VKERKKRRLIPEEIDKIGPDGLKVTIRQTDRGDTIEDADLYDENFGGFGPSDNDGAYTARFRVNRKRSRAGIGHNRPPARILKCRHLLGGVGPTGWAGVQSSGPTPFVQQAIRAAEKIRGPDLGPPLRVEGALRAEKFPLLAQHTERRIQALFCRHHKPTAALEAKRFPRLPPIATKLVPKEASRPAAVRRVELKILVAKYLAAGGTITVCPPETTSKRKMKTKMGRPPIGDKAMTPAERQRRRRAKIKWKQPTPAVTLRLAKRPTPRLVPDRAVGVGYLIKDKA
jgi:hypothetical protein